MELTKSGFVGVVGKPNAGKSTLLNWLLGEKIALVSKKENASRRRVTGIVMYRENQIVLVDTPGLHQREKLLNRFMLQEALKGIGDSDLILFLADVRDNLEGYQWFLELNRRNIPHILVLTKTDLVTKREVEEKIEKYRRLFSLKPGRKEGKVENNGADLSKLNSNIFGSYSNKTPSRFKRVPIVPVSALTGVGKEQLLEEIVKLLPEHPYYYDPELLSPEQVRDIYRELIREALFEKLEEELPYETDVVIEKIEELNQLERVFATIVVERHSQKGIVIGQKGQKIKEIGKYARQLLEQFSEKKIYLELYVKVVPKWTKTKKRLADLGYEVEL